MKNELNNCMMYKGSQSKSRSHYSVCWRKYSLDCFAVIFSAFYFLIALQSDNNSNRVYVLAHNYILGLLRAHFNPQLMAQAKMNLSWAQNIFMPTNIKYCFIIILNLQWSTCFDEMAAVELINTCFTVQIKYNILQDSHNLFYTETCKLSQGQSVSLANQKRFE